MVRPRLSVGVSFVALLALLLSFAAYADGVIVPDDPSHGWLTIVYHDVTVTIRDGVVTTQIDQVFRNETGHDVEGRYLFPLPEGAVVSAFTMLVDGEALEARVLEAGDARTIYEDYVRRAIDPALLEYVGRGALSARIYPIPADEERQIQITYSELLPADGGVYRYRYPLDTERFSARPLERVRIDIDIETTSPLSALYSPTHTLTVQRTGEFAASCVYEDSDRLPSQDFWLYYAVSDEDLGMTLVTYNDPDDDGYFLLVVTPPAPTSSAEILPKDIVLVLDQSGSMSGDKIEQAKEALLFILGNLNPSDCFAVVSFNDYAQILTDGLTEVTADSIADARARVAGISAGGMTNIDQALSLSVGLFEANERPRFLIFLTDGEPTVGEQDPLTIAENALAANETDARLFAFGVGYDVNTVLLDKLALENRGSTTYVLPDENLEARLSSFYRRIASPALANPVLDVEGAEVFDVFPRQLSDIFYGTQLLILGRYRANGDDDALMTVSGDVESVATAYTSIQTFAASSLDASFLPRLWAGRKIAYLLDQIRLYGESEEAIDEVIALSRRYGIITPYTSFLVDETADMDAEEMADAVMQAASPAVGATAVSGASALKTLSEAETVQDDVEQVRIVGDRTYFLRDGTWVDALYGEEETIDIVVYSEAYFDLLTLRSEIGPHLAIGDHVVLRIGERFVRIGEEGVETLTGELIEALAG